MDKMKTSGRFVIGDNHYDVIGYDEKSRKVIIEKTFQKSIFYNDVDVKKITRVLSKNKTIEVEGRTYDLSEVCGLEDQ